MYDPEKPEQKQAVEKCVNAMMDDALLMEGTVSVSQAGESSARIQSAGPDFP